MKKEFSNQEYAEKVKKLTPKFSSFSNCWHAFVSGGAICVLGELIRQIAYNRVGVSEENSYIVVSVCLVLISVVLTGFQPVSYTHLSSVHRLVSFTLMRLIRLQESQRILLSQEMFLVREYSRLY